MKTKKTITILLLLVLFNYNTTTAQVLEQDSLALVAFYKSTGGPNWNNNSNWLTGPVSAWYGVTILEGRVTELKVYSNNLNGTLPNELGQLNKLIKITLSNNQNLTGNIPENIFNVDSLVWLAIGNCAYLKSISFRENFLTGLIPSDIGNIDSLQFLYLFDNQLTGPIPPELGNCTNLWELQLNNNQITGTIPAELTNLENLTTLDLNNNLLSGKLPEYLSNLFFLNQSNHINVSNNMFSGPVPTSWENLSFLIDGLDLSHNNFTSLPAVNYNWEITTFHIEGNKLTFEHIESHYQSYQAGLYYFFYYIPQDYTMEEIDTLLPLDGSYWIYSGTGGEHTNYEWRHNNEIIHNGPEYDTLKLENITYADTGIYCCYATNNLVQGLYLERKPVHIGIDTNNVNILPATTQNDLSVSPNPSDGAFTIYLPGNDGFVCITVFNLEGKEVYRQKKTMVLNREIQLNLYHLTSGNYILQLQFNNSNNIFTEKLIISNRGTDL